MPIEAVKIPQNVYVEDRIIGPITIRQLLITGIGVGIGYMCYALAIKAGTRSLPILVMAWTPSVIAAAFAFLKINDLSLLSIILLAIEGMNKPNQRYWSSHGGLSINLITRQATKEMVDAHAKIISDANRLAELTRQLEKRQEAMNQISLHDSPEPDDVKPVKTALETVERAAEETSEIAEEQSSMTVNPERVRSDGLDPNISIDGVRTQAFNQFVPSIS
jgi:hypothetical protein